MKYLKKIILALFLGFIIFIYNNDNEGDETHYYTTYETYYISLSSSEIVVPVFTNTKNIIFLSDKPYYYICSDDVTYNIKKNYCNYVDKYKLLGNELDLYLVSFNLNGTDFQTINNAYLMVEYNSVLFKSLLGDIIISQNDTCLLNGEEFDGGVKCKGLIDIIDCKYIDNYLYDKNSDATIIYFNKSRINNYIFVNQDDYIYLLRNLKIDLKLLAIYEEEYVKDN